jgi:Acetyltransferase (GNAT) family
VHASTTSPDVCYLRDLFTAPDARGKSVARTLTRAVEEWAREQGCARLYWHTQQHNHTARRLYDDVANSATSSFIRCRCSRRTTIAGLPLRATCSLAAAVPERQTCGRSTQPVNSGLVRPSRGVHPLPGRADVGFIANAARTHGRGVDPNPAAV